MSILIYIDVYKFRVLLGLLFVVSAVSLCNADPTEDGNTDNRQQLKNAQESGNGSDVDDQVAEKRLEILPGHSIHGEVFNEGPRQCARLMAGTGSVSFPITTQLEEAQQFFNQGVGQLHGFWYFEAERSFRQVAALDPDCAMAYWGMAMANEKNADRAKELIAKGVQRKEGASPREVAWIEALADRYAGPDTAERRRKYVRDLEALVQEHPEDVEAKAFLVFQIWANGSWMTDKEKQLPISSHQAVDALIDQVLARAPMHPIHHYRIHLWDDEKPIRAVGSASLCGQSAPAIAHMWHMPGHTFSKLHRYAEAAWQQEASARVDHAHMMQTGILPDQIHNYAHNNEWLVRNLAILGRIRDAEMLAENLVDLPRHPKWNLPSLKKSSSALGRMRLLDLWEQWERWDQVIDHAGTDYFPEGEQAEDRIRSKRLLALAWFGLGDAERGNEKIAEIESELRRIRQTRYQAADTAESQGREKKKSEEEIIKSMADAMRASSNEVQQAEETLAELAVHRALVAGDGPKALASLQSLRSPEKLRKEYLARLWSQAGDSERALALAREAVQKGPNEVFPQAVLVELLHHSGNVEETRNEFETLRQLASSADLDVPIFQRLKEVASSLSLPEDWRSPLSVPSDAGVRPELESLGPFRWSPSPAPPWSLSTAEGTTVTLETYRGKPVVLIFYLGAGCLHCVEQLSKFAPLADQFREAGLEMLAISTEEMSLLQASLKDLGPETKFPFSIAADPELNVFKAYAAFDDFEGIPLHGTYLIDGAGKVRWRDIGAEPFTDPEFLLAEAKRLLGAPTSTAAKSEELGVR